MFTLRKPILSASWVPAVMCCALPVLLPSGAGGAARTVETVGADSVAPASSEVREADSTNGPGSADTALRLTLDDCVRMALESSPDLLVFKESHSRSILERSRALSAFWPKWEAGIDGYENRGPSVYQTETGGATTLVRSRMFSYHFGLREKTPTDTDVFVRFSTNRLDTSSQDILLSPYYQSRLEFGASQPLLRGFDWFGSRLGSLWTRYRVSSLRHGAGRYGLQADLSQTLTDIETAFWDLAAAALIVEARHTALESTKSQLEITNKKIEAGLLVPAERYSFEERMASRRGDLISSERDLRKAQNRLLGLLNTDVAAFEGRELIAQGDLGFTPQPPDREAGLQSAMSQNHELSRLREETEAKRLEMLSKKSSLLPKLDVTGSFFLLGGNTATAAQVGGEGSYGADLSEMLDTRSQGWSLGAVMEVPLGPNPERTDYKLARLDYSESLHRFELRRMQVQTDAASIFEDIEATRGLVETARTSMNLAEKKLDFERQRFEGGITTSFGVIQFQEDLATARIREIEALAEYRKALARIDAVTGRALDKFGVRVTEDGERFGLKRNENR